MAIETIVVLMLENRSFDHFFGYLQGPGYDVDGLTQTEVNYLDPVHQTGRVRVSDDAPYVPDVDPSPGHEFANVAVQLHGPSGSTGLASNVGFVCDYASVAGAAKAGAVMRCFSPKRLPVVTTLAREFAICKAWFSSLPGPTWPNRFFAHCATSGGYVDGALTREYTMRTLYQNLSAAGVNWRVYYHDMPQSLALLHQRQYFAAKYELYGQAFVRDCEEGRLPQYSFIEPRYFNEGSSRANDQHPIHGVVNGELLVAEVYEALRASPQWDNAMLIVTWDENGGFYDHVPPVAATPPDDQTQQFDFASYGVRVPAIVVSPLIASRTIDPDVHDHASIPATAKEAFALPEYLTKRDADAKSVTALCSLKQPRRDAPSRLPRPSADAMVASAAASFESQSLNDLQVELLALARELGGVGSPRNTMIAAPPVSQAAAAAEIRAHLDRFRASLT
ncbi:MAG TPA: alkaline phosphatase family protein [Candidatus Eremiobacteraceae bacterium]|nr:alkaline phosphatase family protein [Candidatus Eremiobacteraceae bacterium]